MKEGRYRRGIFVVIYSREKNNKIEYLILRRKHHWKGWEFTKGGIRLFERKRKAARREVREESGLIPLNIKKFNYKGKYKYKKELSDRIGIIGQTFCLYAAEVRKGKIKIDKLEHSGYVWMSFEKSVKSVKFPNQKKSVKLVNDWLLKNKNN